jgi:hypothetical protein
MDVVLMKKVELVVVVDDLHFGIRNKYGTLIESQIETWKIQAMHICIVIC